MCTACAVSSQVCVCCGVKARVQCMPTLTLTVLALIPTLMEIDGAGYLEAVLLAEAVKVILKVQLHSIPYH